MKIGFVVTELLDGRFVPWESCLDWESYLDLYCLALGQRGHSCTKYVPSILVSETNTYRHRFGHIVKRVPATNGWTLAPRALLRPRKYALGYTTILRQALGPAFTVNLLKEATRDGIDVLHYSSYYSSFFIPAFMASARVPVVVQYTGGGLPDDRAKRLFWELSIMPSLRASRAVLLGDYRSERTALTHALGVQKQKQQFFNAPVVDGSVFHEANRDVACKTLGFNPAKKNILCVTYIQPKPARFEPLSKDPYRMIDVVERAVRAGGDEIEVHVAGWGDGLEGFKRYVEERGMAEHVRVFGRVDHSRLPPYFSACDLLFVPYSLERLNEGSATVEAFACGRPVAAFKRNAEDQTEQDGGFLVEADPESGASTLLERLRRRGYLEDKRKQCLAISKQYTVESAGKRLEEIYLEASRA